MQLHGFLLNIVNRTIEKMLQLESSVKKNQEQESVRLFVLYEEIISQKLHNVARKLFDNVSQLSGLRKKESKNASRVVCKVNCNYGTEKIQGKLERN